MSTETKQKCDVCGRILTNEDDFYSLIFEFGKMDMYDNDIDICVRCSADTSVANLAAMVTAKVIEAEEITSEVAAQQGEEE